MKKFTLLLTILVLSFSVFGQKRPAKKPTPKPFETAKTQEMPRIEEEKTPTQKVYVTKMNGEYLYGLFIGGDTESIAVKVNDATVYVRLDEISRITVGEQGVATRIGTAISGGNGDSISGGVLNGKAELLVRPEYPRAAAAVRASGAVNVQVTIDENGTIISAAAVSGHPLLRPAAEKAALASKFAPTLLEGQPVQVTGIIVYNFVP